MKIVAVHSVKGGVGKTTTATNLAAAAARDDSRVLLWDLDPQAGATWLLGADGDPTPSSTNPKDLRKGKKGAEQPPAREVALGEGEARRAVVATEHGFDVLPADASNRHLEVALAAAKRTRKRLAEALAPLARHYDVVVLDSPPSYSALAESVIRAADLVVLPVPPAGLALRSVDQVRALLAEQKNPPAMLAFLTMVDRRKAEHRAAVEDLPRSIPEMADVAVPSSVAVERMGTHRAPVFAVAPRSPAALAYLRVWDVARLRLAPQVRSKYH